MDRQLDVCPRKLCAARAHLHLKRRWLPPLVKTALSGHMGNLANDEHFRISLAGAQEKPAVLSDQGQWMWPHGSSSATHVF